MSEVADAADQHPAFLDKLIVLQLDDHSRQNVKSMRISKVHDPHQRGVGHWDTAIRHHALETY